MPKPLWMTTQKGSSPAPVGVSTTPGTLSTLSNASPGAVVAALAMIGGTGGVNHFTVSGNANFAISGSNLVVASGASFSAGVNQSITLGVVDNSGGTYADSSPRTVVIPAGPSAINHSPDSILDNAVLGAIATNLSAVGGAGGGTWAIQSGLAKFNLSTAVGVTTSLSLNASGAGHLTAGTSETGMIRYTDDAGNYVDQALSITVQDHTAQITLTGIVFQNSSISDIGAGALTPMFGHAFKKGDIAENTAPVFKLTDGTLVPFSMGKFPRTWNRSDRSLKHCPFICELPIACKTNVTLTGNVTLGSKIVTGLSSTASLIRSMAVSGSRLPQSGSTTIPVGIDTIDSSTQITLTHAAISSGTVTLTFNGVFVWVCNGGAIPADSARATSDFGAGGMDLNLEVVGLDNLTGTWSSHLSDAIALNKSDNYKWIDGACGAVWRFRGSMKQGASTDSLLTTRWSASSLQHSNGTQYGFRHRTWLEMPWIEPSNKDWKSFQSFKIKNGSTLVRDPWGEAGQGIPVQFTGDASNSFTCPNNDNNTESYFAMRLFNSGGTLPTGLNAGQTYFANSGTELGGAPTANKVGFRTGSNYSSSLITASGAGSGTNTFVSYPYITPFSGISTAMQNGRDNYFQGSGDVSEDAPILVKFNALYIRSTQLLPPYELERWQPTSLAAMPYFPCTLGKQYRQMDGTGERPSIGPLTGWSATHFFTQTAQDEQCVRVNAEIGRHYAVNLRHQTGAEWSLVNVLNQAITGFQAPADWSTIRWTAASGPTLAGISAPLTTSCVRMGYNVVYSDHRPEMHIYSYLITGDPLLAEGLAEYGNIDAVTGVQGGPSTTQIDGSTYSMMGAVGGLGRRNVKTGTTTRYGVRSGGQERGDAWSWRDLTGVCALIPEGIWSGADHLAYFEAQSQSTGGFLTAICDLSPNTFTQSSGMWWVSAGGVIVDMWQQCFGIYAMAWHVAATEDAGGFATPYRKLTQFFDWYIKNYTSWPLGYRHNGRMGSSSSAIITDEKYYNCIARGVLWTNGSADFVTDETNSAYLPQVGDRWMWVGGDVPSDFAQPPPGAIGPVNPVYVVSVTGGPTTGGNTQYTCQVAATPGGTPIVNTEDTPAQPIYGVKPVNVFMTSISPPSLGSISGMNETSYFALIWGGMKWGSIAELGASVSVETLTDMATRGAGLNFSTNANGSCKYAIGNTY